MKLYTDEIELFLIYKNMYKNMSTFVLLFWEKFSERSQNDYKLIVDAITCLIASCMIKMVLYL